ncbi:hypothetical protein HOE67_00145 [Candidatus Peregrinibacteria bacterium]|jgi:hypothetical protein|nr:hypothetical protein [Candidatus Peregrinibacteria bacterium]MBT4055504.1 hypothetical protein [Candidatus Peregrinibacteria bacterium]
MLKKIFKFLLEAGVITGLILMFIQVPITLAATAHSATTAAIATETEVQDSMLLAATTSKTSIPLPDGSRYEYIPTPAAGQTAKQTISVVIEQAIGYFKILIGGVAIGFIIFSGTRLVVSGGDEEAIKKGTKGLLFSIAALAIISLSEEVGVLVGFFQGETPTGGIIKSPGEILRRVHIFDRQVEIVMTFIKYLIGSLAVLMIVVNGVKLVVGGGEEENTKKARNGVVYSLLGLVLLVFGSTLINDVFYKVDKNVYSGMESVTPTVDLARGVNEIVGITNFIVSYVGPVLLLLLLIGGVLYLTSGGEEENMNRAKRLIIAALIGVVVIYGAFAVVSTIVSGSFSATANELIT